MLPSVIKKFISNLSPAQMRAMQDYNRAMRELSPEQAQEVTGLIERLLQEEIASPLTTCSDAADEAASLRAHERVVCKFQATFISHTPPLGRAENVKGALEGEVSDVSQGGMSMLTTFELFPGEVLTVLLKSEKHVEKKVYAEVRRCERLEETYKVGVMFIAQKELLAAERAYRVNPANGQEQPSAASGSSLRPVSRKPSF